MRRLFERLKLFVHKETEIPLVRVIIETPAATGRPDHLSDATHREITTAGEMTMVETTTANHQETLSKIDHLITLIRENVIQDLLIGTVILLQQIIDTVILRRQIEILMINIQIREMM